MLRQEVIAELEDQLDDGAATFERVILWLLEGNPCMDGFAPAERMLAGDYKAVLTVLKAGRL